MSSYFENVLSKGVYTLRTDLHWPPLSPKDSHWTSPTPTDPQLTSSDLYWAPDESHWAKCSLHLAPLSYIHPSVTHNDPCLSQMNPIWPQITLNNFRLSLIVLKDLNPTNYVNYHQRLQLFLQKRQPIMRYDSKSHLTSIYSSIIYPEHLVKNWRCEQMDYKPTSQRTEFNISLNRHVRCTLKSNRVSIPFWNHQTFYFKNCWV